MKTNNNYQMALAAIGAAKWRSFLTMLGVIIGVASVVTIVSLGEGVKHQLSAQIRHTGTDLITIRGGVVADYDNKGNVTKVNLLSLFASSGLSDADYQAVQKVSGLQLAAPFAVVSGVPKANDGSQVKGIHIIATNEKGAQALNQTVVYGSFFDEKDNKYPVAVLGHRVAESLFKENVPVGKTFEFHGQKFTVRGIYSHFDASPISPGTDYNNTIFIPYEYAKQLSGSSLPLYQILARPNKDTTASGLALQLNNTLTEAHAGQKDFTVLEADDTLAVAGNILGMLTNVVSAIAAVSLLVGGIGIMNIMLVAVSERTHEIGIRKSVGATNRQILSQFLTEAIVLSGTGGVLGVILSLIVNYLLRVMTSLQPVITFPIMGVAVLMALIVGVIFGITPALKAAHKDPISALRRG